MGADDYVCKPFSPREIIARTKTILRRADAGTTDGNRLTFRTLLIDRERHACRVGDAPVDLTPVEFRLIAAFAAQPGRVFSRENLMEAAYLDTRIVSNRTIDSHVKNLRRKIQDAAPDLDPISSVYGVGYRLEL